MTTLHPTFLMLDIEGSTKIARSLSRKDYLERLHTPVYAELERLMQEHRGTMSGTPQGDDALMVFEKANDAVECALAIQRSLPKAPQPDAAGNVPKVGVRIGLHTTWSQVEPDAQGLYPNDENVIYLARFLKGVQGGRIIASAKLHQECDAKRWEWHAWKNRRIRDWDQGPEVLHELLYDGIEPREPGSQFLPDWFHEGNSYIPRPELEEEILSTGRRLRL